jgi:hypothetical protein
MRNSFYSCKGPWDTISSTRYSIASFQSIDIPTSGFIEIPKLTSHARRFLPYTYNHCAFLVSPTERSWLKIRDQIKATVIRTATEKKLHSYDLVKIDLSHCLGYQ